MKPQIIPNQNGKNFIKVLIVGINYAPDFIGIPKYNTELSRELQKRAHSVWVITAPPYYPSWSIPESYKGMWRTEMLDGVKVTRAPIFVPPKPTGLKRLLHLLSFTLTSFPSAIFASLKFRPDVVLNIAPSLMSAPVALCAARVSGARTWLHIQDFEVDAAFELGLLQGSGMRRIAQTVEGSIFRAFDRVSTISESMRQLLVAKGVREERTLQIRNWVDVDTITAQPDSCTTYRSELNIPLDHKVALYSGNMASKQGLEVLGDLAANLSSQGAKITIVLCGQGPVRAELEARCKGLENVRFLDLQPIERLSEFLATADIHLLPQRAEAADLVLPSKLTGMLASGRAIVAMALPETGLASEVAGCGVVVPPGDVNAMTAAVLELASNTELRMNFAKEARKRAERRWRMSAILDDVEAELQRLILGNPPSIGQA